MADANDITLQTVLRHMQAMESRMMERFDAIDTRFDRLEAKVDRNHAQLTFQIDAIDRRLDEVEVTEVPALKKAVGMK